MVRTRVVNVNAQLRDMEAEEPTSPDVRNAVNFFNSLSECKMTKPVPMPRRNVPSRVDREKSTRNTSRGDEVTSNCCKSAVGSASYKPSKCKVNPASDESKIPKPNVPEKKAFTSAHQNRKRLAESAAAQVVKLADKRGHQKQGGSEPFLNNIKNDHVESKTDAESGPRFSPNSSKDLTKRGTTQHDSATATSTKAKLNAQEKNNAHDKTKRDVLKDKSYQGERVAAGTNSISVSTLSSKNTGRTNEETNKSVPSQTTFVNDDVTIREREHDDGAEIGAVKSKSVIKNGEGDIDGRQINNKNAVPRVQRPSTNDGSRVAKDVEDCCSSEISIPVRVAQNEGENAQSKIEPENETVPRSSDGGTKPSNVDVCQIVRDNVKSFKIQSVKVVQPNLSSEGDVKILLKANVGEEPASGGQRNSNGLNVAKIQVCMTDVPRVSSSEHPARSASGEVNGGRRQCTNPGLREAYLSSRLTTQKTASLQPEHVCSNVKLKGDGAVLVSKDELEIDAVKVTLKKCEETETNSNGHPKFDEIAIGTVKERNGGVAKNEQNPTSTEEKNEFETVEDVGDIIQTINMKQSLIQAGAADGENGSKTFGAIVARNPKLVGNKVTVSLLEPGDKKAIRSAKKPPNVVEPYDSVAIRSDSFEQNLVAVCQPVMSSAKKTSSNRRRNIYQRIRVGSSDEGGFARYV